MKNLIRIVLFCFTLAIVMSCKPDVNSELIIKDNKVNEQWKNKNIVFPSSLKSLNLLDQKENDNSKFNIVVFYDGNCSSCYSELKKWRLLIKEFYDSKIDVSFKFILTGMNSNLVKSYLEEIEFEYKNVFFDAKEEFKKEYGFMLENNYRYSSLLINEEKKIVYVGNIMLFKTVKEKYLKIINGTH
ncbi:MAG: redoxin domain-containing protein [Flavobacteriaceae bacterium]